MADELPTTAAPAEGEEKPQSPAAAETAPTTDAPEGASSSGEAAGADDAESKPVRKKKKKRKKEASPEFERDPIGPDGRERPVFVLAFPPNAELDRLVKAFELGNYAFVREHGPALMEKGEDPAVREAARELVRRIEPDPLIKILLGLSVALLFVLTLWAYKTHGQ